MATVERTEQTVVDLKGTSMKKVKDGVLTDVVVAIQSLFSMERQL